MKNIRRGLGKGLGMGYKNIAPMDGHIHSLSAKGVKTYSKKKLAKAFSDFNVIGIHTGKNLQNPKDKGFAIETKDEYSDEKMTNAIFDRIPEAKNVQAIRNMAKGYYYSVLFAKGKKHTGKEKERYLADYKTYNIYRLERWAETDTDEEFGYNLRKTELYLVPEDEEEEFGEFMADQYGYQDYNNKIDLHKLGTMKGSEIMEIAHQYHAERKKTTKYLDAKGKKSKSIVFDREGNFVSVNKTKLKKQEDYGYYIIDNGLIHFFDDDKNYEKSKIYTGKAYPLGKDLKSKHFLKKLNAKGFKSGDVVYYKDDPDKNPYLVYDDSKDVEVSLTLQDYPDTEQDYYTKTNKIKKFEGKDLIKAKKKLNKISDEILFPEVEK